MFPISITCGKEEHLSLPMEVLINRINGNNHLNLSVIVNHVEIDKNNPEIYEGKHFTALNIFFIEGQVFAIYHDPFGKEMPSYLKDKLCELGVIIHEKSDNIQNDNFSCGYHVANILSRNSKLTVSEVRETFSYHIPHAIYSDPSTDGHEVCGGVKYCSSI